MDFSLTSGSFHGPVSGRASGMGAGTASGAREIAQRTPVLEVAEIDNSAAVIGAAGGKAG